MGFLGEEAGGSALAELRLITWGGEGQSGAGIQPQQAGWISASASLKVQTGPQKEVGGGQSKAKDGDDIVPQPGLLSLSPLPLQDFVG